MASSVARPNVVEQMLGIEVLFVCLNYKSNTFIFHRRYKRKILVRTVKKNESQNSAVRRIRAKAILASGANMTKCSANPGGEPGNAMNISNG